MPLSGTSNQRWKVLGLGFAAAMFLAACGSDEPSSSDGAPDDTYTLEMRLSPSNVAFAIAQDKGLFDRINLEY